MGINLICNYDPVPSKCECTIHTSMQMFTHFMYCPKLKFMVWTYHEGKIHTKEGTGYCNIEKIKLELLKELKND